MAEKRKKETFESLLARLEQIVQELEAGDLSLDASLAIYDEGAAARKRCRGMLEEAEKRIEILVKNPDGTLKAEPFEPETGNGSAPENK